MNARIRRGSVTVDAAYEVGVAMMRRNAWLDLARDYKNAGHSAQLIAQVIGFARAQNRAAIRHIRRLPAVQS